MLPLPPFSIDRIKLADWIELSALLSPDGNESSGDLERALKRASVLEGEGEDAIQRNILDVFCELEARSKAAREAYPFIINGSLLETKAEWKEYPAYVFCLCLSYFGHKQTKSKGQPQRWFEHLSRDAAQHYLGGEALRFGSP